MLNMKRVELRFGQGVCAFLLIGFLRCHNDETAVFERICFAIQP